MPRNFCDRKVKDLLLTLCTVGVIVGGGLSQAWAENEPLERARTEFRKTLTEHQTQPQNGEKSWQFARACFDLAEFATNKTERAQLAEQGIAACTSALLQHPDSAQTHYYLGMNLGQLARTRSLSALKLVDQMEQEFSRTRELDPKTDYAGPDRNLGLLYLDAPTIGSIGSRAKAKKHLGQAVELAPDYPENRLCLIEAFLKWGDRSHAREQLNELEKAIPSARAQLTGSTWTASWLDWDARINSARKKVGEHTKPLEAPRH